MSGFDKLRDIVCDDEALQRRLLAEEDEGRFLDLVVDLAYERGLEVSREDVSAAIAAGRALRDER